MPSPTSLLCVGLFLRKFVAGRWPRSAVAKAEAKERLVQTPRESYEPGLGRVGPILAKRTQIFAISQSLDYSDTADPWAVRGGDGT